MTLNPDSSANHGPFATCPDCSGRLTPIGRDARPQGLGVVYKCNVCGRRTYQSAPEGPTNERLELPLERFRRMQKLANRRPANVEDTPPPLGSVIRLIETMRDIRAHWNELMPLQRDRSTPLSGRRRALRADNE